MALNASGPISLAGATAGESIAVELGLSSTGQISLNDAAVRTLAGVASGAITMPTNFYGKSNAPLVYLDGSLINTNTYVFYTGGHRTITIGGSAKAVTFTLWGGAGGNGAYSGGFQSGSGGFAQGTVTLQPGTNYYLHVGGGGSGPDAPNYAPGGLGGWPNGGFGTRGDASGAGGGGMSMLSTSTFYAGMSSTLILLIAGGGGGTCGYFGSAGAGGGGSGQDASSGGSTGGTQFGGGNSYTYNAPGSYLQGGNGSGQRADGNDDGGGGGGGYYGGGGGTSDARPAGGGSGYINAGLVSSGILITGSYATAHNPGTLLAGFASGKVDIGGTVQSGNHGLALITF